MSKINNYLQKAVVVSIWITSEHLAKIIAVAKNRKTVYYVIV